MNIPKENLRQDLEEQFELPEIPLPMTRLRAYDFRKPCAACEISTCRCIGWTSFDNQSQQGKRT